jgi:hypothetical protein
MTPIPPAIRTYELALTLGDMENAIAHNVLLRYKRLLPVTQTYNRREPTIRCIDRWGRIVSHHRYAVAYIVVILVVVTALILWRHTNVVSDEMGTRFQVTVVVWTQVGCSNRVRLWATSCALVDRVAMIPLVITCFARGW